MPTSYTAAIANDISFNDFVMGCARAMGALILMRDKPLDATIPEWFLPSPYYADEKNKASDKMEALLCMPLCDVEKAAIDSYSAELAARADAIQGIAMLRHKYSTMLEQVKAWEPPTEDHLEFKEFMIEQINTSLIYDCNDTYYKEQVPLRLTGEEWRKKNMMELEMQFERYDEEHDKEIARTHARNRWLRELRNSLAAHESANQGV
ncbi:MAG: hypothetical protein ABIT70_02405 [Sulfuriferula sp.]